MKTKLQIPPRSELFAEYDGKIVFNDNGFVNKGDWTLIDKIFSPHMKKIITACACWEWQKERYRRDRYIGVDSSYYELPVDQLNAWEEWGKE